MLMRLIKKIKDFDDSLMEDVNKMEGKYKDENNFEVGFDVFDIIFDILIFIDIAVLYYLAFSQI